MVLEHLIRAMLQSAVSRTCSKIAGEMLRLMLLALIVWSAAGLAISYVFGEVLAALLPPLVVLSIFVAFFLRFDRTCVEAEAEAQTK